MPKTKAKEKKPKKEKAGTTIGTDVPDGHTDTLQPSPPVNSEKQELLALYQKLKDLGINSISDLEVKISRLA